MLGDDGSKVSAVDESLVSSALLVTLERSDLAIDDLLRWCDDELLLLFTPRTKVSPAADPIDCRLSPFGHLGSISTVSLSHFYCIKQRIETELCEHQELREKQDGSSSRVDSGLVPAEAHA